MGVVDKKNKTIFRMSVRILKIILLIYFKHYIVLRHDCLYTCTFR